MTLIKLCIFLNRHVICQASFILRNVFPCSLYVRNGSLVNCFSIALYHAHNLISMKLFSLVFFAPSIPLYLLSQNIDPLDKLSSQWYISKFIQRLNLLLLSCRPNQSKAISIFKISQERSFYPSSVLVYPYLCVILFQTILKILFWGNCSPSLILKLKEKISKKPQKLRHKFV
jgi:hypothetical protein